jgi:hypothetical protein
MVAVQSSAQEAKLEPFLCVVLKFGVAIKHSKQNTATTNINI